MPVNEDTHKAVDLMREQLALYQYGFGHILTGTSNIVKYDDPNTRAEVQRNVNGIVQGSLLVYLFGLWDNYITNEMIENYLDDDDKLLFRGYKHIRHSVAHRYKGKRADNNRNHFEQCYENGHFQDIIWDKANDTIDIAESRTTNNCMKFFEKIAKIIFTKSAENGPTA